MEELIISTGIIESLDITIIFTLLCLGFLIKHFIPKLHNNTIPAIILITSFAICTIKVMIYKEGTIMDAFTNSVIYSAIAIGLHSSGKVSLKAILSRIELKNEDSEDTEEDD